MTNTRPDFPIKIIDTESGLKIVVDHLNSCPEIFIDTEFDDFNYQYGVHLQLVQIFDKKTCFLIDTIRLKELDSLWNILENERICKVIYSGANDVAIFKKYGCYPKNLFDIQIAAALCNRMKNSYADLLQEAFKVEIDKSQQRSRWDNRPLTAGQLVYASNDVVYLPGLKDIFLKELEAKKLIHMLEEENKLSELAVKTDYEPKLKSAQKNVFNNYAQEKLMAFKLLVDKYARQLNVPPYFVVQDSVIEKIIKHKDNFLQHPFEKGFYRAAVSDDLFKKEFLDLVDSVDPGKGWERQPGERIIREPRSAEPGTMRRTGENFVPFKEHILSKYGEAAGTVMLKGLSKNFADHISQWEGTREYQISLYSDFIAGS